MTSKWGVSTELSCLTEEEATIYSQTNTLFQRVLYANMEKSFMSHLRITLVEGHDFVVSQLRQLNIVQKSLKDQVNAKDL